MPKTVPCLTAIIAAVVAPVLVTETWLLSLELHVIVRPVITWSLASTTFAVRVFGRLLLSVTEAGLTVTDATVAGGGGGGVVAVTTT